MVKQTGRQGINGSVRRSLPFARRNFFASKAAEPSGNYAES